MNEPDKDDVSLVLDWHDLGIRENLAGRILRVLEPVVEE